MDLGIESEWMAAADCLIGTDNFSDRSHQSPHHCQARVPLLFPAVITQCRPQYRQNPGPHQSLATPTVGQS